MKKKGLKSLQAKSINILTVSGVRGSVTLAGAFSIPFVLDDGSLFPQRSLIIFIAAGVILLTLLVASVFLPIMARTKETSEKSNYEAMEKKARIQTKKLAIQAVESQITDANREAALTVISKYNAMINQILFDVQTKEKEAELRQLEMDIRLKALEFEEKYVDDLIKQGKVDSEAAYLCREYVHRMEIRVTNKMRYRLLKLFILLKLLILKLRRLFSPHKKAIKRMNQKRLEKIRDLKIMMSKEAIRTIKNNMTLKNKTVSLKVIGDYNQLISMLNQERIGGKSRESVTL